ncbi:methyltransferase type 11 [Armillaria novae-zelandiae]|uniref:Methyltransferase type 11 n=1 Tax=Armillaria novae-zelandiae TaxID=153914 RepID=A0AA39PR38_9AGAR|nr:methyltransferase type 11 [Armillaria novae-zelandiae]
MSNPTPISKLANRTYATHGYHDSVLRAHQSRTAQNSAAYLLPELRSDMNILDVGCGPGTITADFAALVYQGHVVALDITEDVMEHARMHAEQRGINNITFQVGSVLKLPFQDNTFDVVHAHQVIQHISDPINALQEMHRVTKDGGIVAVRSSDVSATAWFPDVEGLNHSQSLYMTEARSLHVEPDAGRQLHSWAKKAGFRTDHLSLSTSTTLYSTTEEVAWWSGLWAERVLKSSFAETTIRGGFASWRDLTRISDAWRTWGEHEDAWYAILHGEMLCHVRKVTEILLPAGC